MDLNIIGWVVLAATNIAVVAFMYGRTSQKVSNCVKAIENGLIEQVQNHGERITRIETIVERQEARGDKMDSKLDTLLERSEIAKKE